MNKGFHEKGFDEATQFKLRVFRRYVREWISVLLTRSTRQFTQLNIFDFFAGPGRDGLGSPGSPLIIVEEVKAFCQNRETLKADIPVRMVFNDKDSNYIATLKQTVGKERCPKNCCHFEFGTSPFVEILPTYLPQMGKRDHANLVLMDQFGVKEATPQVVRALLDCRSTDILFFISSSFIRRFIRAPEIQAAFSLDPNETRNVEYRTIHRHICDYYRSALGGRNALLAPFSIKKGSNIYGLIFATGHRLGMEKFLKVCWDLDPATGEANYSVDDDPAWHGDQFLLPEMNRMTRIGLFERAMVDYIRERRPTNVELYGFCLEQGFCASKAAELLRELQKMGKIAVTEAATRTAARKGSFYLTEAACRVRFGVGDHAPKQD